MVLGIVAIVACLVALLAQAGGWHRLGFVACLTVVALQLLQVGLLLLEI